LPEEITHNCF